MFRASSIKKSKAGTAMVHAVASLPYAILQPVFLRLKTQSALEGPFSSQISHLKDELFLCQAKQNSSLVSIKKKKKLKAFHRTGKRAHEFAFITRFLRTSKLLLLCIKLQKGDIQQRPN